MKLLIVAQKFDKDDDNLGIFYHWCLAFAARVEQVVVIANAIGDCSQIPENMEVYSLGKELGASRIKRYAKFMELFSFYYAKSDAVFFHMIPEFIIAAFPFLLSLKRTTALWYVHKSVTWKLKIAERLVDYIFTASHLSFRLPSKKVIYTGHAIDTEFFKPIEKKKRSSTLHLLALGRIAPVKDYETIIRACALLKSVKHWKLSIVGGPIMKRDEVYIESLRGLVREKGLEKQIEFTGPRPYAEIPGIFNAHDIFITMSNTGSIDKAVLEAMSAGLNVIVANEAFRSILPDASFIAKRTPELLAERIVTLASASYPNHALRDIVVREHALARTVQKITDYLNGADV